MKPIVKHVTIAAVLTAGAVAGSAPAVASRRPIPRMPEGQIAYVAEDKHPSAPQDYDVHVINADGSGAVNLTPKRNDYEVLPQKSPDGTQIAYLGRPYTLSLWVMDSDGREKTRLTTTHDGGIEGSPFSFHWSPDGKWIVYSYGRELIYSEDDAIIRSSIHVLSSDGAERTRLTSHRWAALQPAWSPDGRRIAYASNRTGKSQIHVMEKDGSGKKRLTDAGGYRPRWSPDGSRLVFSRAGEVWVMNANGSGEERLAEGSKATFSPDGSSIAFVAPNARIVGVGRYQVWVMEPDDLPRPLTPATVDVLRYDWSPSGDYIVYDAWVSPIEGTAIFVASVTAPVPIQITHREGNESSADW